MLFIDKRSFQDEWTTYEQNITIFKIYIYI